MKRICTSVILFLLFCIVFAQKSAEQLGGVYHAYEAPGDNHLGNVPDGYVPFYISHYGRHGSRWLTDDSRYEWVLRQFEDVGNLTRKGRYAHRRLQKIWENARGNGGRLTSLGAKQHRGIARRMLGAFPMVFTHGARVEARSSVVGRCVKSMEAFVDELKTGMPTLQVMTVADSADMRFLSYDSPDLKLLQRETRVPLEVSPQRLIGSLFKVPERVQNAENLMSELFTIASDMQDIEDLNISLYDLFTYEEMYALYVWNCAKMFHQNGTGTMSRDIPAQCAANLWQNIADKADEAIANGRLSADLRFGHDTGLYRLLSLLKAVPVMAEKRNGIAGPLDEIVPMAANLQMIFCRDKANAVTVGFFLNEKPVALDGILPAKTTAKGSLWYIWDEVKRQYQPYIERQKWKDRVASINTMVGTDYAVTQTVGRYGKGSEEHGQTLPAVLEPHGHTFWTPQTRDTEQKCVAPYYYGDSLFQGFRGSHWLVGGCTQDYGSFTLMPMMDSLRLKPESRATPFTHCEEVSHPHYYAVTLPREHLLAEMTGRSRAAIFRFTADQDGDLHIVIHPNSDEREGFVTVDTVHGAVWGYNPVHRIYQGWGERAGFSGWFVVQFDRPITCYGVQDSVAFVTFRVRRGDVVQVKAASSFTDLDGARRNMAEIPGWDFLGTRLTLDSIWQRQLQTIDVESRTPDKVGQFYGALYRASFLPRVISDVDGSRPRFGLSDNIPATEPLGPASATIVSVSTDSVANAPFYSDFSMWDIYRAQLPLLNIIAPHRVADMLQSLVGMYEEGGWMPIFPCWNSYTAAMIGDHAASVFADALVKGNDRFDVKKAYEGLRKNAFEHPNTLGEYRNGMGRRALKSYLRHGYIPLEDSVPDAFHTHEQVSRTLEYAYDDFCLAQMAARLSGGGRHKAYADDYRTLMARADNWRQVFNPRTGWVDGRHADGRWLSTVPNLTSRVPFITEGAVAHYSFYVPHAPTSLVGIMGGRDAFAGRLDALFGTSGSLFADGKGGASYWHGNEPCHHIPYLYAYAGRPWQTQRTVHHILSTEYLDVPGGLSGNDDAGQMSAWYVFSALGFYPLCPGTPYYMIGTPMFERATIGRLTIEAPGVTDEKVYIQNATWNGMPYTKTYITHDMITRGGTLRFTMGAKPNTAWGTAVDDLPPDMME